MATCTAEYMSTTHRIHKLCTRKHTMHRLSDRGMVKGGKYERGLCSLVLSKPTGSRRFKGSEQTLFHVWRY